MEHGAIKTRMKDSRAGRLAHPILYKIDMSQIGQIAVVDRQ
jgi:hypothetical protein